MLSTQIWIPWTEVTVERMFFLGSVQLPALDFGKPVIIAFQLDPILLAPLAVRKSAFSAAMDDIQPFLNAHLGF